MTDREFSGLHIDSDWKAEAAKEKERLAKLDEEERSKGGAQGPGVGAKFIDLLNLLAMQAAIALGGYQGPGGERIPANPHAARHHIDLIGLLEEKTRGNLTDEEKRLLEGVLYELRLQYVQVLGPGAGGSSPSKNP